MKKILIVVAVIFWTISTNAQTKQEIYCNPDIIWAGTVDIDIVPQFQKDQNWDIFAQSGYSKLNFNPKSTTLKKTDKTLSDYVIGHANAGALEFYTTPSLTTAIHYQMLELTNPAVEPETIGDRGEEYPTSVFEVYRLRCLVYYTKGKLDFNIVPQAVAVIRTEYDGPYSKAFYNVLGWLPVGEWAAKDQQKNISWAQQIHSDIALDKIRVFKQELTITEIFEQDMIPSILEKTAELNLLATNNFVESRLMTVDEKKEMCTEEIIELDPNTYEEVIRREPINAYGLAGINFSVNWAWDDEAKQFLVKQTQYSPILHNMDHYYPDTKEEMFLEYMFTKKIGE